MSSCRELKIKEIIVSDVAFTVLVVEIRSKPPFWLHVQIILKKGCSTRMLRLSCAYSRIKTRPYCIYSMDYGIRYGDNVAETDHLVRNACA